MQERQDALNGPEMVCRWARHPRCVGLARVELRKALAWGLAEIEDTALVVLSELVTNAVRHAHVSPGREIETRFQLAGEDLRIEVHDDADEWPRKHVAAGDSECGRGLVLVSVLADRWGVGERGGSGKAVWALMTVPPQEGDG
ncbi:ATP-binding protein [Streptomyces sp. V1I1]|uniref:ATP-binding protein n=1 Tax=Streptomyces sp. V1I1 TaxID=3042272 RepID=UPI002781B2E7|nr:ATP-binding protein [Streptomyces sp. V1I1]MDQ0941781.1 serine/threonine-protein kinase RsbW [Streptomyces sp. V1I1]